MRALGPIIAILVLVVLIISGTLFTVDQRQNAIVFQLGEIKDVVTKPGLHFKIPLIQNVRQFDMRILAEAYRDAQRVRGDGDAKSAAIYAAAFSQNPEFFAFYRSMEAYRSTFRGRNDLMLLETNSDFLRYFRDSLGRQASSPRK